MKKELNNILIDIYQHISTTNLDHDNIGILDGISGVMIFDILFLIYEYIIYNKKHYVNTNKNRLFTAYLFLSKISFFLARYFLI